MKQETIKKATKVINRNIKFYSRQIRYLKLKMEKRVREIILPLTDSRLSY